MLAPLLAACQPQYVDNNGTRYYDANDVSTDGYVNGPYTKSGQYLVNPDEATNTRDNRGMRPMGYDHDVNDDFPAATTSRTVIYPAGGGDGTTTVVTPANPGHVTVIQTND
jgi:hypothetical protein